MKRLVFVIIIFLGLSFFYDNSVYMKDFIGEDYVSAREFLHKNNIKYEINYLEHDSDEGTVISQSVLEGEKINSKIIVNFDVSSGKNIKEIYKEVGVNELGRIPVMMYHGIYHKNDSETDYIGGNVDASGYHRTTESFRRDLDFFYKNDYRMIRMSDYSKGHIEVELGKSPIVLTFDDGLKNNINILGVDESGELIIDPNSAVGILEEYKKKYPDFNVTATFFLNGGLFHQPQYNDEIINWLLNNGYDVGNHGYSHLNLSSLNQEEVVKEIGSMYKLLSNKTSDKYVNIVALPFGAPTNKNHENFEYVLSGVYDDYKYSTISTLRVGWESDLSPFHKSFDKTYIKRIRAYDNDGKDFDIKHNFKILENSRYISSGNSEKIVVPISLKDNVSEGFANKVFTY